MGTDRLHRRTREEFGEPICRVLKENGVQIVPSTYNEARDRAPSKRTLRDAEIVVLIMAARQQRFLARFGARRMWLYLRRQGHDVARCTIDPTDLSTYLGAETDLLQSWDVVEELYQRSLP